jgi:hypothetical protein
VALIADFVFFTDIFVNFMSAYERPGTRIYEIRPSYIAKDYLSSWFAVDLLASIPVPVVSKVIGLFTDNVDEDSN